MASKDTNDGYDPARSTTKEGTLTEFLRKQVTSNIESVPGIGPAGRAKLSAAGVNTLFQLIGKFLSLKDEGVETIDHCDRFWYWLKQIEFPPGTRGAVVQAIAELTNIKFPGTYDAELYAQE